MPKAAQIPRISPTDLKDGLLNEELSPIEEFELVVGITSYDNHEHVIRRVRRDAGDFGIELVQFKTTKGAKWDSAILAKAEAWRLLAWWIILDQHI